MTNYLSGHIHAHCDEVAVLKRRGYLLTAVFVLLVGALPVWASKHSVSEQPGDNYKTRLPIVFKRFGNEGYVRFFKNVDPVFYRDYVENSTPELQSWMRDYYWRMYTFPPYFDPYLSWYPNGWAYKGLYAIYRNHGDWDHHIHPDNWFVYDVNHNKLFNKYGTPSNDPPMWAANICEQGFRDHWLDEASEILAHGYRGLWIDYVNMTLDEISDASGNILTPYDYSGQEITLAQWRDCMARFTEQIRAAFPDKEIIHNALWWWEYPTDDSALREIRSSTFVCIERGINDGGLDSQSFDNLLSFIDAIHSQSRNVVFRIDSGIISPAEREYGLAGWLLISNSDDGFSSDPWSTPADWWQGYELDMGYALGSRYIWHAVLRRDFQCGVVLLNKPEMVSQTIALPEVYTTISGEPISSVTLEQASGVILLKPCATFQHHRVFSSEIGTQVVVARKSASSR